MRHDFTRSLANKTSGMTEGETRTIYIYAGNVYAFRADGYMHGEMITSFSPDNKNKQMLEDIANEYDTIDQSTENASLWSEVVQSDKGGRSIHGSIVDGGRSNSSDTLYEDSSESYTARYTERERQNFETKAEIDEVVNKLREMYGLDTKKSNGTFEETQSNDIVPINETSSTGDVFFDEKNPMSDPDIRYSLTEYTAEEKKAHNDMALQHFGRAFKWAETGYLLLDGSKLDLSGKHDGAPGGYRTVDHRDITDALGYDYGGGDYSGSMIQFMSEGNIRIVPEIDGINLSVKPTKAQEQALSDFISRARGEVVLDIDDLKGNTVVSVEYPRGTYHAKVLNDIREWFDNGKQPKVSGVSVFRSLTKNGEAPVRNGVPLSDLRLDAPMQEDIGPVREDISKTETAAQNSCGSTLFSSRSVRFIYLCIFTRRSIDFESACVSASISPRVFLAERLMRIEHSICCGVRPNAVKAALTFCECDEQAEPLET